MDSARIRVADRPPAFCASCYAAKPQQTHVDFGAAYDAPTFAPSHPDTEVLGGGAVTVDDLIICQECVKTAAEQVGYSDATRLQEQIAELTERLNTTSDRVMAQAQHIENLERALTSRPRKLDAPAAPVPRADGRPPRRKPRAAV